MPRLYATFDSNVYRGISQVRFDALRRAERAHSVVGVATPWVAQELLARLAVPDDAAFGPAWAGLRRLEEHCRYYDGARHVIPFVADVEQQVAFIVFARTLPPEDAYMGLAALVGAVVGAAQPADLTPYRAALAGVARHVATKESEFAESVWNHVVRAAVPDATSWADLVRDRARHREALDELASPEAERVSAEAIVNRIAAAVGWPVPERDYAAVVRDVQRVVRPAIRLQLAVLRRVVRDGLDLRVGKHANTFWDLRIAFCASAFAQLGRTPVWLVTNDRPVLAAARASGTEAFVFSLDAYEAALRAGDVGRVRS